MVYWSASEAERMPVVMDAVLQKYFPEKTWGAIPLINKDGVVELVTIDKVEYTGGGRHGDETKWTHYANIQLYDGDVWELNEQFKGKNEDEMWIYGYYKSFANAVRNLATKGTKDRKPIKIWM